MPLTKPAPCERPAFWRGQARAWLAARARSHGRAWPAVALALESLLSGKTPGDVRGLLEAVAGSNTWGCGNAGRSGRPCAFCRLVLFNQALAAHVNPRAREALAEALLAALRRRARRAAE